MSGGHQGPYRRVAKFEVEGSGRKAPVGIPGAVLADIKQSIGSFRKDRAGIFKGQLHLLTFLEPGRQNHSDHIIPLLGEMRPFDCLVVNKLHRLSIGLHKIAPVKNPRAQQPEKVRRHGREPASDLGRRGIGDHGARDACYRYGNVVDGGGALAVFANRLLYDDARTRRYDAFGAKALRQGTEEVRRGREIESADAIIAAKQRLQIRPPAIARCVDRDKIEPGQEARFCCLIQARKL